MVGVAVNVTFVPAQIGLAEATMLTAGVTLAVTVTLIAVPVLSHPVVLLRTYNVPLNVVVLTTDGKLLIGITPGAAPKAVSETSGIPDAQSIRY